MTGGTEFAYLAQITTGAQWLLRLTTLVAACTALGLLWWWAPMVLAPAWTVAIVVGVGASFLRPDSWVPAAVVGAVALWWQLAGRDGSLWQAGVLAILVAVFHLGCTLGGLAPAWAGVAPRARRRWLATTVVYLLGSGVAGAVVVGVSVLPVARGVWWLWLSVGALGVLVWLAVRAASEQASRS